MSPLGSRSLRFFFVKPRNRKGKGNYKDNSLIAGSTKDARMGLRVAVACF